jgi:predicted nucleic-acid-binding protein
MIGLDTNVLVRYLVKDDPVQADKAVQLIHCLSPEDPGWLGQAATLETVWVLTRIYGVSRVQVIQILDTLLSSQDIVVDGSETVREALRLFRSGKADFPDCLIASFGKAAGCVRTVTFDRIAARDAGMELIT